MSSKDVSLFVVSLCILFCSPISLEFPMSIKNSLKKFATLCDSVKASTILLFIIIDFMSRAIITGICYIFD